MKVSLLHSSTSALLLPSTIAASLPRRLGLGFRETAVAAMSGNREPDPDPLLQQQQPPLTHNLKNPAAAVAEPEEDGAPKNKDVDIRLLQNQLGEPPEKPLPGDCCGSGCVRCIWDIYFEELELYNSRKAALDALQTSR